MPISPMKEILVLRYWHEYVGTLRAVITEDDLTLLEFDDHYVRSPISLDVEQYIGKRIGVLRTDIEGKEMLVRKE